MKVRIVILFIGFLYILFPTNNSSLDAYNYAAHIKYADYLFSPHHLLYSVLQYVILKPFTLWTSNVDVLTYSKYINSLFVLLNLWMVHLILKRLKIGIRESILLILIVAFSYNTFRFGTENETYIIPIFFSLLGSLFFLKFSENRKLSNIFLSGLFAAMAGLFHQIHFFWWFGLLIGLVIYFKNGKYFLIYFITTLVVPIVYFIVIFYYNNTSLTYEHIVQYVFHDYFTGSARTEFGYLNVILILISSIRSFFQVHPNIIYLIKQNISFVLPLLVFLYFIYLFISIVIRKKLIEKRVVENKIFFKTTLWVLLLQFLFAFYSVGNVEFLVMLPILVVLSLCYYFKFNTYFLTFFALTLFAWNFIYGIYPNHKFRYYNEDVLVDFIVNHPNDFFYCESSRCGKSVLLQNRN